MLSQAGTMIKREISIHIGQFYASKEPAIIYTLLGSCVAVCLYDSKSRIGGMNHILLPGRADLKLFDDTARYGINAMELLINKIMSLGGNRHGLVAKVFGGAHVLPAISTENGVGRKNAAFALEFLEMESIKVISQSVGGHESRKIYFHTDTGDVFLKRIPPSRYSSVVDEERDGLERIEKEVRKQGKMTTFFL